MGGLSITGGGAQERNHATPITVISSLNSLAGQLAGLLHPTGELGFVELVLVGIEASVRGTSTTKHNESSSRPAGRAMVARGFGLWKEAFLSLFPILFFLRPEGGRRVRH